jgi:hypothetical protein
LKDVLTPLSILDEMSGQQWGFCDAYSCHTFMLMFPFYVRVALQRCAYCNMLRSLWSSGIFRSDGVLGMRPIFLFLIQLNWSLTTGSWLKASWLAACNCLTWEPRSPELMSFIDCLLNLTLSDLFFQPVLVWFI